MKSSRERTKLEIRLKSSPGFDDFFSFFDKESHRRSTYRRSQFSLSAACARETESTSSDVYKNNYVGKEVGLREYRVDEQERDCGTTA